VQYCNARAYVLISQSLNRVTQDNTFAVEVPPRSLCIEDTGTQSTGGTFQPRSLMIILMLARSLARIGV